MMKKTRPDTAASLVLASASPSRRKMLTMAGISCLFDVADIDETAVKEKMSQEGAAPDKISEQLAIEKAMAISPAHKGKIILGADQLLVCEGRLFDKPRDMAEAARHLRFFRGKSHYLFTSYALIKNQEILVCETVRPRLVMRDFSDEFLADYLSLSGQKIQGSVGCYLLEGLGPQLFSEIDGDYFAILGLPLLNVMENLRRLNIIDD
ncbi:Septum formation protein Maf [hydrothermal vent metagenome]|uniref:Septum formation protein Maf n=1 Tax=hydrothermal vent metagenome TaxID=652676 RepID=A0A3B0SKM4_9ZZZZ